MLSLSNRSFWLSAAAVAIVGCSGDPSSRFSNDRNVDASVGSGSGGAGGGGVPPPPPPGTGGSFTVPLPPLDYSDSGAAPDHEPTKPGITHPRCGGGLCTDFPETPIVGEGVPDNAPTLFGDPTQYSAGTLCVQEPQLSTDKAPGAMIPANWVRPRFKFAGQGLDLFEIRIHSPAQKHDLVAYTKKTTWYLPKEIWAGTPGDAGVPPPAGTGAANNGAGTPFTVTIRGINSASPGMPVGIKGDFEVAPVVATGSMVFWTVNSAQVTPESSKLL